MDILSLIPNGKENAISRKELVEKTGMHDRSVREAIEQLRHNGHLICTNPKGGYYQPASIDDVEQAYWTDYTRAKAILHRLKTMRRVLKEGGREVYGKRS